MILIFFLAYLFTFLINCKIKQQLADEQSPSTLQYDRLLFLIVYNYVVLLYINSIILVDCTVCNWPSTTYERNLYEWKLYERKARAPFSGSHRFHFREFTYWRSALSTQNAKSRMFPNTKNHLLASAGIRFDWQLCALLFINFCCFRSQDIKLNRPLHHCHRYNIGQHLVGFVHARGSY